MRKQLRSEVSIYTHAPIRNYLISIALAVLAVLASAAFAYLALYVVGGFPR